MTARAGARAAVRQPRGRPRPSPQVGPRAGGGPHPRDPQQLQGAGAGPLPRGCEAQPASLRPFGETPVSSVPLGGRVPPVPPGAPPPTFCGRLRPGPSRSPRVLRPPLPGARGTPRAARGSPGLRAPRPRGLCALCASVPGPREGTGHQRPCGFAPGSPQAGRRPGRTSPRGAPGGETVRGREGGRAGAGEEPAGRHADCAAGSGSLGAAWRPEPRPRRTGLSPPRVDPGTWH